MNPISRRSALALLGGAAVASACRTRGGDRGVVRVGLLANLSNAPVLAALADESLARAIAPARVEARVFRAGPRVVEALLGGAIDVGVTGPAPVVFARARHGAGRLRVISGCASGGASLVLGKDVRLSSPRDLKGTTLAVTQLGSTQDIALRAWLHDARLTSFPEGDDVHVTTMAPASVLAEMRRGTIAGGWFPEPWATRVVTELGAQRAVDERDLWPERRFASALVVADRTFSELRAPEARAIARAIEDAIARAGRDPAGVRNDAHREMTRQVGNPGKLADLERAWSYVDFTPDPLAATVRELARRAETLGLTPRVDCTDLFA